MIAPVRSLGSGRTHLAEIDENECLTQAAFGAVYASPPEGTVALCGVRIKDGVVMRHYSESCRACTHILETYR